MEPGHDARVRQHRVKRRKCICSFYIARSACEKIARGVTERRAWIAPKRVMQITP